jgi:phosphoribosylglycinamide formyltransferase 2
MIELGTPNTRTPTKLLLLGSGELGKEVALEAQRLGVEVIACDRYASAPAMQVAHRAHVFPMLDAARLRAVIEEEKPDFIVPEIEAIATDTLLALEEEGHTVIPTARAARLTMDREGIRRLAAETLELRTSPYRFASTREEFDAAVAEIGCPCVVKPVMSSSGRGQSTVKTAGDADGAWAHAQEDARGGSGRVIVEGFVDFDYEITLLTIRHVDGTAFCAPVGHRQVDGDYHESWQPQPMSPAALETAQAMARAVTDSLGGRGLFGVEFFVRGDEVWFSEVSPRPHDTGMVTMISQDLSEFALHVRAILGLPIPNIRQHGAAASYVILGEGDSDAPRFSVNPDGLRMPDTALRLFGKPEVHGHRRLGVGLARGDNLDEAKAKAKRVAQSVDVHL